MGAIVDDESKAIEELKGLSAEARGYISHHFRNSIQALISATHMKDEKLTEATLSHMVEDLERIAC